MNDAKLRAITFMRGPHGLWGAPYHVEGGFGIAKTSKLTQFAQKWGFPLHVVIGSILDPTDIGGFPIITVDGVRREPLEWAKSLCKLARAIVLLDELTCAALSIQHALLRVVLERVIGDVQLPKGIRIFAASNPPEVAGSGYNITGPLANRFVWDTATVDVNEWLQWLATDGGENGHVESPMNAAAEEDRVTALWPAAYAHARGLLAGYMTRHPGEIVRPVPEGVAVKGHPTPRSWEMCGRLLASSEIQALGEVDRDDLLAGAVGAGSAESFCTWQTEANIPHPADVLDGKVPWKHDPKRPDRSAAVLMACATMLVPKACECRHDRADRYWELCLPVLDTAPDLVWTSYIVVAGKAGLGPTAFGPSSAAAKVSLKLSPTRDALK